MMQPAPAGEPTERTAPPPLPNVEGNEQKVFTVHVEPNMTVQTLGQQLIDAFENARRPMVHQHITGPFQRECGIIFVVDELGIRSLLPAALGILAASWGLEKVVQLVHSGIQVEKLSWLPQSERTTALAFDPHGAWVSQTLIRAIEHSQKQRILHLLIANEHFASLPPSLTRCRIIMRMETCLGGHDATYRYGDRLLPPAPSAQGNQPAL